MASVATATAPAMIDARPSLVQHYDTAMRRARLAHTAAEWQALLAVETRHYRSAVGPRRGLIDMPALAAWQHALDASPWVLPAPDFMAHVVSAYACMRSSARHLDVGAHALAEDQRARVVQIRDVGKVQAWLQRLGPVVIAGDWPIDSVVKLSTETIEPAEGTGYAPHAVAIVGIRPDAVRVVNNRGAVWGALGRAWLPLPLLARMLESGEAWGVVPVDLVAKASAQ